MESHLKSYLDLGDELESKGGGLAVLCLYLALAEAWLPEPQSPAVGRGGSGSPICNICFSPASLWDGKYLYLFTALIFLSQYAKHLSLHRRGPFMHPF